MELDVDFVKTAEEYATKCHRETNHLYDGKPYYDHLVMVVCYGLKYLHLVPYQHRHNAIAACWAHDTIEDTRQTYNDVKNILGEDVAEIVFALTNEKGKTRAQRANGKYYSGIRVTPCATFVKVCDRLANAEYSKEHKSSMFDLYKRENNSFAEELYISPYEEMFNELENILQ